MRRFAHCFTFLLPLLFFISCRQPFKTEKEEVAYWNARATDTARNTLYKNEDTTAALLLYDSILNNTPVTTVYPKAIRFEIVSNYFHFFTKNTEATASLVDSALAYLNTPALQDQYPRTCVGLLLFGGNLAYRLQQYNKAADYYFKAKRLGETHLDLCEQSAFNYSLAMVLYRQQSFQQSLHYFAKAYALQNTCAPQTKAVALQQQEIQSNIGLCLVQLEQYDSALLYFDKALAIADQYRDTLGTVSMEKIHGVIYGNKAQVYMAKNNLQLAEGLCRQSIALNGRKGYEVENARQVKLQLAEVYGRQGNSEAMRGVLDAFRKELDTLANPNLELGWRRLMYTYYEKIGSPAQSLAHFKSYAMLRDSIQEQQQKLSEADVTRQLDVKEKEMQIALLKKDNQVALLSFWVTVGAAVMVMAILVLIYYNYRRNKKNLSLSLALNKEIQCQKAAREAETKQRHKEITEAVIQAQESERALIGLELHDNINQVLTTVKLLNEMVLEGMGDARVLLPRAARHLQECINEIRSLSKRLSAPSLGKISLEESVNDLLDSVNLTSKVQITRKISGMGDKMLRQDLHLGLYRILQEQLNNVLKHSEASEVVVQLNEMGGAISLSVADNGKGFALNSKRTGIGLMNMQTRAENLNGTFELLSAPQQGCKIKVVVPIPKAAAVASQAFAVAGNE